MADLLYRKIADDLRQQIESGTIRPGEPIPTELELRDRHQVSRNVVRDAIHWLAKDGLVEPRRGQGYFARLRARSYVTVLAADPGTGLCNLEGEAAFAEVKRRGGYPWASVPRVEVQFPTPEVAAQLEILGPGKVITRQQKRFVDQQPWSLQSTAYPAELAQLGAPDLLVAKDIEEGTVAYLARTLHLAQVGLRDEIQVRPPDREEANFFGFPQDDQAPVVSVQRTGFRDASGSQVPFRSTVTVFPADRVRFVIDSGQRRPEGASAARRLQTVGAARADET